MLEEVHPMSDAVSVTLFKAGDKVTVPVAAAPTLERDGWTYYSTDDLPAMVEEVKILASQVSANIAGFIQAVTSDGVIDPHDGSIYEASLTARKLLDQKISEILSIVHTVYPMRQGETLAVTDPTGVEHQIDPGQEDEFMARGWKKAQ